MKSNINTERRLILYLKRVKWWLKLETLYTSLYYFTSLFIGTILLLWLVNFISISLDYSYLESGLLLILILPVILFVILFGRMFFNNVIKKTTLSQIAESFEKRKDFSGEVISSADFIENDYSNHKTLEKKFIQKTVDKISNIPIHTLFQSKLLIKPSIILGSTLYLLFICSAIFSYTPFDTLETALFGESDKITLDVDYPKEVLYGRNFLLNVKTNADKVSLILDSQNKGVPLKKKVLDKKTSLNLFKYKLMKVDKPFSFSLRLTKKGIQIKKDNYRVEIYYYPVVTKLKATLTYPKAYRLSDKVQNDGNVEGFNNTHVKLELESNNKLKEAYIFFEDSEFLNYPYSKKMNVQGKTAKTQFKITDTTRYYIDISDNSGNHNIEKPAYYINLLEDESPYVQILKPAKDLEIKQLMNQPILVEARDDYMVKRLILYYYHVKASGRKRKRWSNRLRIKADRLVQTTGVIYLSRFKLKPGDSVEYFVRAVDHGGQVGESFRYRLTLPSVNKFFQEVEKKKNKELKKIEELLKEFKKLRQESKKLKYLKDKELDKKLKELAQKEKRLMEKIRESVRGLENLETELALQKHDTVKELKEKVREIKKLLSDLLKETEKKRKETLAKAIKKIISNSKKLRQLKEKLFRKKEKLSVRAYNKQRKRLSEKDQQLNKEIKRSLDRLKKLKPDVFNKLGSNSKEIKKKIKEIKKLLSELLNERTKRSMKELERLAQQMYRNSNNTNLYLNTERYIKRLEKTLDKLRKLKELQSLLEARHLTQKLKERQSRLNNKIKTSKKVKPLQKKAQAIEEKSNNLLEKLNPLLDKNKISELKKAIQKSFKNMKDKLSNKLRNKALESGQNLLSQFSNIENHIQKKIQEFQQREKNELMVFLRNLLFELIELRKMEGAKSKIVSQGRINPNFTDESLTKLIETTLFSKKFLLRQQYQFDKKLEGVLENDKKELFLKLFNHLTNKLTHSGEGISKRDFYFATHNQKDVLQKLNQLSLMLMKLKIKAQQGQNGGQSSNNLNQLISFQNQINKDIQKLMQKMKNGKLSKADEKALKGIAKRQGSIGKEIEKMLSKRKQNEKNSPGKLLGNLAELKREIEEIKQKMEKKKIDKKLVNQQKRLLKRLSNAAKHLTDDSDSENIGRKQKKKNVKIGRRSTLLKKERNLLKIKKNLRKTLRMQKKQSRKNLRNLTPKQKKVVKEYFKSLKEFSEK